MSHRPFLHRSYAPWLLLGILCTLGCEEELRGPAPSIDNPTSDTLPVDPGIICSEQHPEGGTIITASGATFAPVAFDVPNGPKVALPDVVLRPFSALDGSTPDADTVLYTGEDGGENSSLLSWASQDAISFRVTDALGVREGIYHVAIINPDDQEAVSESALAVVDRPVVTNVDPALVCVAQGNVAVDVTGSDFLRVGDLRPSFTIGDTEVSSVLDECTEVRHPGLDAETCERATLTIERDALAAGEHAIVVRNPETAACTSLHEEDGLALHVVGPPVINAADPASICDVMTEPVSVTFSGENFVNTGDDTFKVFVAGSEVQPTQVDGCQELGVADAEACSSFTVTIDPIALGRGPVEVTVENPASVGCSATTSEVFVIVGPPTIADVQPDSICSDQLETITVTGTGFAPGASVSIGDVAADSVEFVSDAELRATFSLGVPAGTHDVTVDNGAGCATTLPASILVDPTPIVFFVDPPVTYDGIATEITIFTSGLDANAIAVEIVDSNQNVTSLAFTSPLRPNRILATVPAGLPAGQYEVRVTSEDDCTSVFNGTLTISDTLTLNLSGIDPSFISSTRPTAVTVTATAPPDMTSTPRIYLNPDQGAAGVSAMALDAIVFVDAETLTAVVPEGLAVGAYDVIVVNPTGEVGVLDAGLTVMATEPPVITSVAPSTLANNSDYDVTIAGENFDPAGVTVEIVCENPAGVQTTLPAAVSASDATSATATIPSSQLAKGSVCVVRLTNTADGSSATYSAISITNSSFNLEPWEPGPPMVEARRGLSLEAGRPTQTSRFLYAAGGDAGSASTTKSSVEFANVGVFGGLAAWNLSRSPLPAPRAFGGLIHVGRYLYYIGGTDGTAAQASVYRAQILDPLESADVTDVDATLGDGVDGLGGGLWMYRVAALYPASHPENPGGESLPGNVQFVDLPEIDDKVVLTVQWEPVAGASGYRVYRSPAADASIDQLELLAEIADPMTLSFTDRGIATMAPGPLLDGSTGTWQEVGTLGTAREAHATVVAPLPGVPDQWVVYAMGGRDAAGTYLDTIEWAIVTVAADGSQSMSAWQTAGATLDAPRAELSTFVVTGADTAVVPADRTWIYVGPGRGPAGLYDGMIAFEVPADGVPTGFLTVNRVPSSRAGYASGASNGFLYIFGGQQGGPSNGGISAEMCSTASPQCVTLPPDLRSGAWNSLGISMSDLRVFHDLAQESAFYFVAGGSDGTNALRSVDQTVQ